MDYSRLHQNFQKSRNRERVLSPVDGYHNQQPEGDSFQKVLIEYCEDNGLAPDFSGESNKYSFEDLLALRSEMLGDRYKNTLPFWQRLYTGRHSPEFLLAHYSRILQLDPEEIVDTGKVEPGKDLVVIWVEQALIELHKKALGALSNLKKNDKTSFHTYANS